MTSALCCVVLFAIGGQTAESIGPKICTNTHWDYAMKIVGRRARSASVQGWNMAANFSAKRGCGARAARSKKKELCNLRQTQVLERVNFFTTPD
jgi:hypothetical protein